MVEALFIDEGPIFTNGAKPIGDTFIDKLSEVEIRRRFLTGSTSFSGQLLPLSQHRCKGVGGSRQLIEHLGYTMGTKARMATGRLPLPLGTPKVPSGSSQTQQ